jgi:hypothetical protein
MKGRKGNFFTFLKGMFSRGNTSKKSGVTNNQSVLDDLKKSKLEVMENSDCWFIFFSFYVRSDELCFPVKTGFQNNDCISLIREVGLKKNVILVVNVED